MAPAPAPDIGPFQEAILVLRDVGIIGCLVIFIVGSVRGWWTFGVRVKDARQLGDEQPMNKVVLSFPGARRRRRRRRR